MSLAGRVAGRLDGLDEDLQRLLVGGQVRREAALVADAGRQATLLQHPLQRVVRLDAPAQRLAEARRADRHDHELLEVDVVVGVHAAVQDVHHRHRQHVGVGPADVAVERQLQLGRRGPGHGQRHAEDGVGAEAGLVVGAVEVDQRGSSRRWSSASKPSTASAISPFTLSTASQHALAAVAVAAVAQLDRLVLAGRRARRHDGPTAWRRSRAAPRPRRWGCHASRGPLGRRSATISLTGAHLHEGQGSAGRHGTGDARSLGARIGMAAWRRSAADVRPGALDGEADARPAGRAPSRRGSRPSRGARRRRGGSSRPAAPSRRAARRPRPAPRPAPTGPKKPSTNPQYDAHGRARRLRTL